MKQILLVNNGVQEAHTITTAPNEIALLDGSGLLPASVIPAGAGTGIVLQVKGTVKTDTFNQTIKDHNWFDVPGLELTITPASTSNRIMINTSVQIGMDKKKMVAIRITRNGAPINIGAASGNREPASSAGYVMGDDTTVSVTIMYIDTPALTSAVTYKVQVTHGEDKKRTVYINRSKKDKNKDGVFRLSSTMGLMEIDT